MDSPHTPLHRTGDSGWYFITAGTYRKEHILGPDTHKDLVAVLLRTVCAAESLFLHAWVILSNHYHLIVSSEGIANIPQFIRKLHSLTARELNVADGSPGRRVWYQYWDKQLTHERSYLARLNYIHQNPVHHGIVARAEAYRWSSLREFEERVEKSLAASVRNFKAERLDVFDPY